MKSPSYKAKGKSMLGIYALIVLSIDLAISPISLGLKYFDPQYYTYRKLCLIYPAQIVHDKPLHKLYRHEVKSRKKAQKLLDKETKQQNAQILRYNKLARSQNHKIRKQNKAASALRYALTLAIGSHISSRMQDRWIITSPAEDAWKYLMDKAPYEAYRACAFGAIRGDEKALMKQGDDSRAPCHALRKELFSPIALHFITEAELESIAKEWQAKSRQLIAEKRKREAAYCDRFGADKASCLEHRLTKEQIAARVEEIDSYFFALGKAAQILKQSELKEIPLIAPRKLIQTPSAPESSELARFLEKPCPDGLITHDISHRSRLDSSCSSLVYTDEAGEKTFVSSAPSFAYDKIAFWLVPQGSDMKRDLITTRGRTLTCPSPFLSFIRPRWLYRSSYKPLPRTDPR